MMSITLRSEAWIFLHFSLANLLALDTSGPFALVVEKFLLGHGLSLGWFLQRHANSTCRLVHVLFSFDEAEKES